MIAHPETYVRHHGYLELLIVWYLFSNAVSSLPVPKPEGNPFYLWAFTFLHGIAGNIGTLMKELRPAAQAAK